MVMTLEEDATVWWYDEQEEKVNRGRVLRVDKYGYVHFHKEPEQPIPPQPRLMAAVRHDRAAAIDEGIQFLETAKLDLDRRIHDLQALKEGQPCQPTSSTAPTTNPPKIDIDTYGEGG